MESVEAAPTQGARALAYGKLYASMTLVGTYVALSKPLTGVIPVFALAFLRFAIAAVAMLPWTGPRKGESPLTGGERQLLFLQSFFGNFLFSACMLYGVAATSATAAGIVMSMLPATVALGSALLLRERVAPRALAAVALAVAGIALLAARAPSSDASASLGGSLLVFGAVCCEAVYVLIGKRLASRREPLRVSALINLWGLVLTAPFGLWQLGRFDLGTLTPAHWLTLLFYSLAASLFAVWLWMSGLRAVPAHQAGIFTVALPVAATAVGALFLGEPFGARHALALGCALSGIALVALPAGRREAG